jgi:hypothetical protein
MGNQLGNRMLPSIDGIHLYYEYLFSRLEGKELTLMQGMV